MGLDYTFQMIVPRQEAVGTLQDIAAIVHRKQDDNEYVIVDNQRIDNVGGDGEVVTDRLMSGVWLALPQDDILGVISEDGSFGLYAELTMDLNTKANEASFKLAAVTTRDSICLEKSTSFRSAIHGIAGRRRAFYCVINREDNPLLVTWYQGVAVNEELPSYYQLPSRQSVEKMLRAVQIEHALKSAAENSPLDSVLGHAIDSTNPEVRTVATKLVNEHSDNLSILTGLLRDPSTDVRAQAALNLGELKNLDAVPALIAVASDESESVRNSVITTLGKIGSAQAIGTITAALSDPSVRGTAMNAICQIEGPESDAALLQLLAQQDWQETPSYYSYGNVLGAVWNRQLREAVPILCAKVKEGKETEGMTCAIVEALGLIGDPAGIDPALHLLANGDGLGRCYAIWALHNIGDRRVLPDLERMLADGDDAVQKAAKAAIEDISQQETED